MPIIALLSTLSSIAFDIIIALSLEMLVSRLFRISVSSSSRIPSCSQLMSI
ncbi:MAG: hypothetical protein ACP5L5_08005 [Vulcanisaeta sp.]|uniref:hypothetical protein n=1 Tax=Vulcanisaeta TaxID=164450 RepID=UPI001390D452|nr:hypothetical protein [Vulcanisaeta moutnovskia]